jgi:hypothetical protein
MKKGKLIGKILGIALVFVLTEALLAGLCPNKRDRGPSQNYLRLRWLCYDTGSGRCGKVI